MRTRRSTSGTSVVIPEARNENDRVDARDEDVPPPPPPGGPPQGQNQFEAFMQAMITFAQQARPAYTFANLKEFLQHKPPIFKGTPDPLLA